MTVLIDVVSHLNRRQWIQGASFAAGTLVLHPTQAMAAAGEGLSHNAEAIHQEVSFSSSPKRIYETLMSAEQFQKVILLSVARTQVDVTSRPAEISHEPGGPFMIFGGYISGRHIELVPSQRIVQAWHEKAWDPGVYSLARFELHEAGTGTKLLFDHTGFPAGAGDHLSIGWKINYWEPLAKFLGERA
jgi:activator of HSP90 ATPase